MNQDDRDLLKKLNDRLYSERLLAPDRFGHQTLYTDYKDGAKLAGIELKRVIDAMKRDPELLLLPTSTTWGFGGPCYMVVEAAQHAPGLPTECKALFHVKTAQMPEGWGWKEMLKHFPPEEKMHALGWNMYGQHASAYDY